MSNSNKQQSIGEWQKIINTLQETYPGKSFALEGKVWKTNDVVTAFQNAIDIMNEVDSSHVAWTDAVTKQKAAVATVTLLVAALKAYFGAVYGKKSPAYAAFGFVQKAAKVKVEARLAAVEKGRATRKARNTMGKRQRKAVTGATAPAAAPAAGTPAATTPAMPAATTPAIGTPSGGNGTTR
jgi:hypothetical protein